MDRIMIGPDGRHPPEKGGRGAGPSLPRPASPPSAGGAGATCASLASGAQKENRNSGTSSATPPTGAGRKAYGVITAPVRSTRLRSGRSRARGSNETPAGGAPRR